jgi:hypothetical protein
MIPLHANSCHHVPIPRANTAGGQVLLLTTFPLIKLQPPASPSTLPLLPSSPDSHVC